MGIPIDLEAPAKTKRDHVPDLGKMVFALYVLCATKFGGLKSLQTAL